MTLPEQGTRFWRRPHLGRRSFFHHLGAGVGGYFLLPSRPSETVARAGVTTKGTAKNCIFILMSGGPSHVDTFDFKEGDWTPTAMAPTSFGDVRWPMGLLPNLSAHLENVALVRSVKSWALVHVLARTWVMIGRNPAQGSARFAPHIGSVVSQELQSPNATLPAFVSLNTNNGPGAGFLPSPHNPFYLSPGGGGMANSTNAVGLTRLDSNGVARQHVGCELQSFEAAGEALRDPLGQRRLAHSRRVFHQQMPLRQQRDECQADRLRLAQNGRRNIPLERRDQRMVFRHELLLAQELQPNEGAGL